MDDQALTKPYSLDLRDRAVARVVAGETVRSVVAATLRVGVSSAVKWPPRFRATGSGAEKDGGPSAARSDWRTPGVASAADRQRAGYDLARAGRRTSRAGRQGELSNGLELRSSREDQL